MENLKLCIFDLDGVICDTAKYHYLAWKKLADGLNISFSEKDNERLKGVSRMESLDILLSLNEMGSVIYTKEEKHKFAEEKNKNYLNYIKKMTQDDILPGVETFILCLRDRDIKIALGSVSKNAAFILDKLEISELFDVVVDGTKVQKAKPNPEVFLKSSQIIGVTPDTVIVFEDAFEGVKAAKNAGMKCVGVGNLEVLKEADLVISDFENLSIEKICLEL